MRIILLQKRGLGNQLFQYAAALYFARKYKASLEIIREPEERAVSFGRPRRCLLSKYCISTPIRELTLQDRLMCSVSPRKRPVVAAARWATGTAYYCQRKIEEQTFVPDLPISQPTSTVYLEGNFQAHQYALDMEEQIRKELRLREPPTGKGIEALEKIGSFENPVSLHIRRGDYAVWKGGPRVLSLNYHMKAMKAIIERVSKPTFFVFSDDIAFARENLPRGERTEFVGHNDEARPHEDLRLMSACRHHIVSNSTFSWWGAWLSPDRAKVVCAPRGWGIANLRDWQTDLIPPGWLMIDAEIASKEEATGHCQFETLAIGPSPL